MTNSASRNDGERADRRRFLKESVSTVGALALGASYSSANGSVQDRIRVGLVGAGSRGGTLLAWAHRLSASHNVQITAICDLWERRRLHACERVRAWEGHAPTPCRTIAEVCDRSDVDAVLIASADFQHCWHAAHAAIAGKDVYVERPFGCDFEQVERARAVIAQTDRVVQMGTQARGSAKYEAAAEFVRSGGLGQITYVEIAEPVLQPRWRIPGSESAISAAEIDWDEFRCYLPATLAFDPRHFREFRLFWPYSSGPFCQWMSHRIDLVNLVLGSMPTGAVALGGVFLWKDGRTNPDTVQALLEYPGGTLVSYHMRMGNSWNGRGITLYGTRGTLELDSGVAFGNGGGEVVQRVDRHADVPEFQVQSKFLLRAKRDGGIVLAPNDAPHADYLADFFENVRLRRQPSAGVEAGYAHSVACILANQSYRTGVKMTHDLARRRIGPASVGNASA